MSKWEDAKNVAPAYMRAATEDDGFVCPNLLLAQKDYQITVYWVVSVLLEVKRKRRRTRFGDSVSGLGSSCDGGNGLPFQFVHRYRKELKSLISMTKRSLHT